MSETTTELPTHAVNLTEVAQTKVRTLLEQEGVEVIVDKMSAPYLDGSTIDFEDTIEKQGFSIDNPNAAGSCACGDSFH